MNDSPGAAGRPGRDPGGRDVVRARAGGGREPARGRPGQGLDRGRGAAAAAEVRPERAGRREGGARLEAVLQALRDYMQIVLVVAAVVSLLIGECGTAIGLALLTLFNAWLGYHQEGKAEAAAAHLGQMMKSVAKVRRDGVIAEIPADQIVPGDIVVVDAGDRVPADGRVILAATLQVEEGALTGESVAVEKDTGPSPARRRHRRPPQHGLHEHQRHPRSRRDPRHHDGDGLRGRAHRPHAGRAEGGEDPAHQAGRPAHDLHHHRGPVRVRGHRGDGPRPGRVLRGAVRHRRRAGGRLHPRCSAGGRHHDPVGRVGQHGQEERHHEVPAGGGDARLHLGDQLRQDRHADAQPDDRP